jgi:hypothetical protein
MLSIAGLLVLGDLVNNGATIPGVGEAVKFDCWFAGIGVILVRGVPVVDMA